MDFYLQGKSCLVRLARDHLEETNAKLVMYKIKPTGKTRLQVVNPKNLKKLSVEFMIVKENCNSVLGARASQQMKLLQVISANIFEVKNKPNTIRVFQQPLSQNWLTKEYPKVFEGEVPYQVFCIN